MKKSVVKKANANKDKGKSHKPSTIIKAPSKKTEDEIYETDEDIDNVEFDADEDEFFDEKNFRDFNAKIKFRVFDPENYENEIHKEIIIVPNQYRKTSDAMSKFEYTDVVSNRAKQIENGSIVFTDVGDESDPIKMAELEIRMKKCPLSIKRMISNNIAEVWAVNEMINIY
jgi:DNA-directed RNA polymerase subunit K/omega